MHGASSGVAGLVAGLGVTAPGRAALLARLRLELGLGQRLGRPVAPRDAEGKARWLAQFLADRGFIDDAVNACALAERACAGDPTADVLALYRARILLTVGRAAEGTADSMSGVLAAADDAWSRSEDARVIDLLDLAFFVLFHPAVQFTAEESPFTRDPAAHLAPLRESAAWRAITARRHGPSTVAHGPSTPRRLLVVAFKNWNFVRDVVEDYRADPRAEVRTYDLVAMPELPTQRSLIADRIRMARGGPAPAVPPELAADLAWADTVFVEWGHRAAAWLSLVAPAARLVARIHSYEAWTSMPQLTDFSVYSQVVFVSPGIRQLLQTAAELSGPELVVIPNRKLLGPYRQPKVPGAERTLCMVGWASMTKDPAFALDVLEILRRDDASWRLLLIGPDIAETPPARERDYLAQVRARITALGDAVEITGQTAEVPHHLTRAGVILSTSRREGTHEGFIEGVASAALPVCRNWPVMARWGGPRALFPAEWIVESPEEAAARIRELADNRDYCERQADAVVERFDWSMVRKDYDDLLLG